MLLIIGIGLVSGVFIGRKIIKNSIENKNLQNKDLRNDLKETTLNFVKNCQNQTLKVIDIVIKKIDSVPYVVYKRLHSITGIVFVGGFVIAHFINNSLAYNPKRLNELSESIHKNPLFPLIEILGIYVPLFSHVIIGTILLSKGKIDLRIKSETNYRYIFQRISAYIILKALIFHLVTIRLNEYLPASFRKIFNIPDKRDLTYQKVNVWFKGPLSPIGYLVYSAFVTSVSYHLSNGIWTSAITWGLVKTYEKQVKLRNISNIFFTGLTIWGHIIMYLYSKEYNDSNNNKKDKEA